MMSFDRRKCKVLNGPTATGQQCPEGWTVYTKPGPKFQGGADYASTDMLYMTEIDRDSLVFTTDRDFLTYRRNRRERIPLISPF